MNKLIEKYKYFLLIFVVGACSYKPIYSGMNYSFNIGETIFTGERQINNIIQNRFNLIKDIKGSNQKIYNLQVDTVKRKLIVSNDSKGDPLKFELIVTTNYKIFEESEFAFGSPVFALKDPFSPNFLDFLKIIFIIPPLPSASYLAEGEVITSTFSIASAGNCLINVELIPTNLEGFPLIKILAASFPLKRIFPSKSVETDGILSKTSFAVPPLTERSLPTV